MSNIIKLVAFASGVIIVLYVMLLFAGVLIDPVRLRSEIYPVIMLLPVSG